MKLARTFDKVCTQLDAMVFKDGTLDILAGSIGSRREKRGDILHTSLGVPC